MHTLEQQIEEEMANAVDRIVRLTRVAAIAAFESHFNNAFQRKVDKPKPSPGHRPSKKPRKKRAITPARSQAEIISLSARLLKEVRADPGQTMAVLAPRLGAGVSTYMLQVPVAKLKQAGQVKTVGQRHLTRYFPAKHKSAA